MVTVEIKAPFVVKHSDDLECFAENLKLSSKAASNADTWKLTDRACSFLVWRYPLHYGDLGEVFCE